MFKNMCHDSILNPLLDSISLWEPLAPHGIGGQLNENVTSDTTTRYYKATSIVLLAIGVIYIIILKHPNFIDWI
jgi:hypothetical protein